MRSRHLLLAVAIAMSLGFADPSAAQDPREVQGQRLATSWILERHLDLQEFDVATLVHDALAVSKPGEAPHAWLDRLARAFTDAYHAFAPLRPTPDDTARYRLPFALEVPRYCVQGIDGAQSHTGSGRFAFDFAMPVGTPILAARAGTVARVRDGFTEAGLDPSFIEKSNEILVLHDDGTFGDYAHLRAGAIVRPGKQVNPGDLIGYSGNNGFSTGPHLHFAVYRRAGSADIESVPIRFGVGSATGFVPVADQFYGGAPKSNVPLVVTADGKSIDAEKGVRVAPGDRFALAVSLAAPGAAPADVTLVAQTHYLAPTSWSVTVDNRGVVTASPSPDYAAAKAALARQAKDAPALGQRGVTGDAPSGNQLAAQASKQSGWGVVLVSYEDTAHQRFGFASVPIVIDAAR